MSSPSAENTTAQGQRNVDAALAFLDKVKERFETHPTQYDRFLNTLQDYHSQRQLDNGKTEAELVQVTRTELSEILKGEPELLEGLEVFMPESSRKPAADISASK